MSLTDILEPHSSGEAAEYDDDVAADYKTLITRAKTYTVKTLEPLSPNSTIKKKENLRKKVFFKCKLHDCGNDWSKENDDCSNCLLFKLSSSFPNGKLYPVCKLCSVICLGNVTLIPNMQRVMSHLM
jgi:hypothetical protein